jgi:hypothetical protein
VDEEVVRIARTAARIELARHDAQLKADIARINAQAVAAGVAGSGLPLLRIAERCAHEAVQRGERLWLFAFYRVLSASGVTYEPGLEAQLKSLAAEFLSPAGSDLRETARVAAQTVGLAQMVPQLDAVVAEGLGAARDQVWNEIDVFVATLRSRVHAHEHEHQHEHAGYTVNVYAPLGTVQAGDRPAIHYSAEMDASLRMRLEQVLETIELRLAQSSPPGETQALATVREARAEVCKPHADPSRLATMLAAVAGAIRMVESLKPALDALRALAQSAGIHLPW